MKPHLRVLGLDDAPFKFSDATVPVVGVVVRAPNYLEGVLTTRVTVDGDDATDRLLERIAASRYREGLALIMLDGVAMGGFNLVDTHRLHEELGIPVATVTRRPPDLAAMEGVLRRKFPDAERRIKLLRRSATVEVPTAEGRPLIAGAVGIAPGELRGIITRTTVRGSLPEPLRLAHLIATAMVRGESHGRA